MGSETRILTSAKGGTRGSTRKTRVMIVDDSLTVRAVLSRMIDAESDLEVTAKTSSAELALGELRKSPADVILLDLEMPGMGGLNALPQLLAAHEGIQVLVVSSLTKDGAEPTLQALSMGAADTMEKPNSGGFDDGYRKALLAKIRALGPDRRNAPAKAAGLPAMPRLRKPTNSAAELLAIGASTGGIHALCLFLRSLPKQFTLPIVVTQHLPDSFMSVFARQLELASSRKATLAADGTLICDNRIYIAPGKGHLNILSTSAGLVCKITHESTPSGCMPSVDPMLSSIAQATQGNAIAVVLSGMGKDGLHGAQELVDRGGCVFAQDQETSAVWGMPRQIAERGLASAVLPPAQLATKVAASAGACKWK